LPLVYDELRKLAATKLAHEKPGQTLQATALVHEAYVRLVGGGADAQSWDNRGHFFAAAAEAMRRILVERARRKGREKRGGHLRRIELAAAEIAIGPQNADILALDEALTQLAQAHPEKAELVKLRYFAGLTGDEAARALGISPATADRYWTFARAWLFRRLAQGTTS
jgi:RNA polymerase sigma factor (TIGR02999 family)